MPGKQDPYFPLNLNSMNGFYSEVEVGPILIPHRHPGKFETASVVHHGSPIAMALHNSPVNTTILSDNLMSEYINLNVNTLPPVNSEDEEEDDIVSQSGSESVSVQGSDLDLDVEVMDDVDSLVLNIRDKLRMAAPQFSSHSSNGGEYCWTESPSATSTPNSIHSTASNNDNDLLILSQQRSSSAANKSSSSGSSSSQRKRRASLNRSSHHWRLSHPNATNSYFRQFHHTQSGSISKAKKSPSYQPQWWSSRSFSDLSKQSRSKDAYHLLQELLQSGTLIKEAVRRLNKKCVNSATASGTSTISNCPSGDQDQIAPGNPTSLVVSTATFPYMDEDPAPEFHQHQQPPSMTHCN